MRGGSGVKTSWPVIAIALAVIGVPMGVAVIQDLGSDTDEEDLLARIGEVNDITDGEDEGDETDLEEADDVAGRWHEPAMDQEFFDAVFLGGPEDTGPALRGPLAGFEWGAQQVAAPDLSAWSRAQAAISTFDGLHEIAIVFPDDGTAARVLASRWGEPLLVVGTDDLARRIWGNAESRVRVVLESHDGEATATFSQYVPASDYIDSRTGRFAFESYPVLGATADLLAANYGAAFTLDPGGSTGRIACPGIEISHHGADCTVSFAGGRAVALTVTVSHVFDPTGGPKLFAHMRERLGAVRDQASDDFENRWTFDGGYTVTQRVGEPTITIVRVAR